MATNLNITNIPAPRVPFIDERTGLMSREWYRFFLNLFVLTGSGNNPTSLDELQIGPPNQPDLTELLIQINQNVAPQYEDQSGDFLATLDTAQLMSMMARFENAEAAIQGAYLQPVVQTGTIANYNLDNSPTAGGVVYGTGPALAVSAAGTSGQVLKSNAAGAPTWVTDGGGTVTSVSVVSANGLAGTVATATTTPAITLSTTITGLLKGNGTAISAAASGTDYAPATSGTDILYGNGSGGFSNVTIGTGVAFAGGTLSATGSGGTVTSVTGTAPVVSSGGATPAISMAAATTSVNGYLTSTDWTTFNGKQAALVSGTNIKTVNGTTLLGSGDLGTITYAYGGTGLTSYTAGDLIYASAANTVAKLAIGSAGQRLVVSAGLPSWATDTTVGTVTSVSWTGGIVSVATATTTPAFTIAGTSGGIPYFSSGTTWASSAALAAGSLVLGGGAGVTPATTTTGTGVVTALGVNTGTAGAFVVNGGALGTPSSGTVTNLTGTASININGTVGATTATTGAFTTVTSSNTTDSSSITTGAVTTAGGLGVTKKIYVGDNVVIATAGKGIDFSATTGTGTSELLNDYEEGTWTPADGSGAGLIFTVNYAKYTKVGQQVSFIANISYPVNANATAASIQGFPFSSTDAIFGNVNYTTESAATLLYFAGNTTKLFLLIPGVNTTNAQMSGEALIFSGTYFI